jgi:hypothetical protein
MTMGEVAKVNVLHSILTSGGWVIEGSADIPLADALNYERRGKVEIVSVNGAPYVHGACCSGGDAAPPE